MKRKHRIRLATPLVVAVVAVAIVLIWRWPVLWAPMTIAAIVCCMILAIVAIDRRARHESALPPMSGTARDDALLAAGEKVGVKTALTLALGLAAIAVVVACAFLDWKLVGIGALVVFAWMLLLGLPFWTATIEEEIKTEHDQLTGESR